MTKKRERLGALLLAVVFFLSAVVFSVVILFQSDDGSSDDINAQLEQQLAQQEAAQDDCEIGSTTGDAMAVPEAFKPEGDVTELQVTDIQAGTGQEVAPNDCVEVKYHGTLASNGEKFDGNYDSTTLLRFRYGVGTVIPGWDQGLEGMKVGGIRRLVIPSELGYGEQEAGAIPANSDLVFVVTLVRVGS